MTEENEYSECQAIPEKEDTCEECGMILNNDDFRRELTHSEGGHTVRTIIGYECHHCGHYGEV